MVVLYWGREEDEVLSFCFKHLAHVAAPGE